MSTYVDLWDNTTGCSACYDLIDDGEDAKINQVAIMDSTSREIDRQCLTSDELSTASSTVNYYEKEGDSCGWGYVYDYDMSCRQCSDIIANCTLCATSLECKECNDPTKLLPSKFTMKD